MLYTEDTMWLLCLFVISVLSTREITLFWQDLVGTRWNNAFKFRIFAFKWNENVSKSNIKSSSIWRKTLKSGELQRPNVFPGTLISLFFTLCPPILLVRTPGKTCQPEDLWHHSPQKFNLFSVATKQGVEDLWIISFSGSDGLPKPLSRRSQFEGLRKKASQGLESSDTRYLSQMTPCPGFTLRELWFCV